MPRIESAKKRMRQAVVHAAQNRTQRSRLRNALKKVRTLGGDLRLVIDQEKILKVFKITALTQVFTIHETLEDALAE